MPFRPQPKTDSDDGGSMEGWPTFVQDVAPTTTSTRYVWVNTSEDPPQVFVEDGT